MTVDNFGNFLNGGYSGGRKHMAACNLDRRSLLAAMLIGAGLASIDQASAEVAPALKAVLGFARGSFSRPGVLAARGRPHPGVGRPRRGDLHVR